MKYNLIFFFCLIFFLPFIHWLQKKERKEREGIWFLIEVSLPQASVHAAELGCGCTTCSCPTSAPPTTPSVYLGISLQVSSAFLMRTEQLFLPLLLCTSGGPDLWLSCHQPNYLLKITIQTLAKWRDSSARETHRPGAGRRGGCAVSGWGWQVAVLDRSGGAWFQCSK